MHRVFRESVHFHTPHVCLGMRLEPLTLGHKFLLCDLDSPFVTFTRDPQNADLWAAVMLCALPYRKALKSFHPGLVEGITTAVALFAWGLFCRRLKLDMDREAEKFFAYLRENQSFPPTRANDEPGKHFRTLKAPSEWRLAMMMQQDYGLTWQRALETPILRAHAIWATKADREGWINLASSNEPGAEAKTTELWSWAKEQDTKAEESILHGSA